MKNYQKPKLDIKDICSLEKLSSLGDWLEGSGAEYENAGITTYVVES